jgi:hypothetical protein
MESSAKRILTVSDYEAQAILAKRESLRRIRGYVDRLEESLKAAEQDIIAKLDQGADRSGCAYGLRVKETLRRYPAWKEHFIAAVGKEAADRVLEGTEPKSYRNLIIEVACLSTSSIGEESQ